MSLTAFMFGSAIARAFSAPCASTASTWPGSALRRSISARIGASLAIGEFDQRVLEGGELRAAEGLAARPPWSRRSSAAKMPTRLSASGRPASPSTSLGSALGIGLGAADLLRDRVRVVGQRDQRIFRRVGLRHFLRAVAQAHHARRRPLDQRLGQREDRRRHGRWRRSAAAKSLLNFCAMSRASSRCCFWSSPTGTCVAR